MSATRPKAAPVKSPSLAESSAEAAGGLERRFRQVLENSRDVIYQLNLKTVSYDYVSPSVEQMLGYSAEEIISGGVLAVTKLTHPEDLARLEAHISHVLKHTLERQFIPLIEYRFKTRHRGWRWISDTRSVVYAADGSPEAMIGNIRDITGQKETETELHNLFSRLLAVRDEERRRLARELHDSTGQNLAALSMHLAVLGKSPALRETDHATVAEMTQILTECQREIRTTTYLLHPPILDDMGLNPALGWLTRGFTKRSGIRVSLDLAGEAERLPVAVEIALFRVVQEALTNIHRHSGSPTATISLRLSAEEIRMEVADRGRGIAAGADLHAGVGICGMQERLHQLNGVLEIKSDRGGTCLSAVVPRGRANTPAS